MTDALLPCDDMTRLLRLVDRTAFAALRWSAERQHRHQPRTIARITIRPASGETVDDTARRVLDHMRAAGFEDRGRGR